MNGLTCTQARPRLVDALRSDPGAEIAPEVRAHLDACPTCQMGLLMLNALALSAPPKPIDCARCQLDLAAFVEREGEDGPLGATRAYPHVWWHLWTCLDCRETYDMLRALVAAQQRGELNLPAHPPPAATAPPKLTPLLHLSRQFLRHAIPAPAPARGSDEGPYIISEAAIEGGRHIRLIVDEQPDRNWTVMVTVIPAQAGRLVLALGAAIFRAAFDESGHATILDVPATLLAAPDGPDLVVGIETDGEASAPTP